MGNRTQQSIKYPSRYSKKEMKLSRSLDYIKDLHKKGNLSKEEIELCESIPGWKWWNTEKKWISKEEFIQWCKDNGIKTFKSFRTFKKENKSNNIPSDPNSIYKDWSWSILSGRFLNNNWISKEEFIQWCKDNGIKTFHQYVNWKKENKRPINIPSTPRKAYKDFSWKMI